MRGPLARLPIRWRVTAAFTLALVTVMSVVGALVYLRMRVELTQQTDSALRARAAEIAAAAQRSPAGWVAAPPPTLDADESVAQILRPDGDLVAAGTQAGTPLLAPSQVRRALQGEVLVNREGDDRLDEAVRLLARPFTAAGEPLVVVVGASLDEQREALASLLAIGSLGLLAAALAAGAAGYVVAGVALQPVEAMRRRAAEITDRPDGPLPVMRDDEIGRLGATLNAMLARLQRAQDAERDALERERRFVADASHELRTPLTILKSEVEVALLGGGSRADLAAALASVGEETDRLCGLTDDLLTLARSDDAAASAQRRPVALQPLLAGALADQHLPAGAQPVQLDCPDTLLVTADAGLVRRAVGNLLRNALQHGSGHVRCSATQVGGEIVIAVRDHGSGFPVGFRDRAFERFSRAEAARGGTGTGLGLAIVQAVARAHDGHAVATNADPGALVEIRLPAGRPGD